MKRTKGSKFTPQKRDSHLETYLDLVSTETIKLLKIDSDSNWENMSLSQREALKKLKQDNSIIIKPADKGGAIVILDRADYEKAISGMLQDKNFYKEVKEDLNPKFQEVIQKYISKMKEEGYLNEREAEYLKNEDCQTPRFYGLPKIHKIFDHIPSFRPIVSGCGSCCERISNFVDFFLQPLTHKLDSYVKDTNDFVRKIKTVKCKKGDILVSADVTGLYTVINHEEGVQACKEALDQREEDDKIRMPTTHIEKLIQLILKSNCFSFLKKFYHQCTGTAMGTPMAPGYANLFMGKVEREILQEFEQLTGLRPTTWLRFLDDVFFLWPHGEEKLREFMQFIQDFAERKKMKTDLKFTFEIGESVPFLDTVVSLTDEGFLKTDLYSKKTDAHLYLRKDSCHPPSCTKGLIKGELLRARRICTKDQDFKISAQKMKSYFQERGFRGEEVDKKIEEVSKITRDEALEYKKREENKCVPFVLTFHPRLRQLGSKLQKHFHLLQTSDRLKKAFPEAPMVAFRRQQNLKDLLVHTASKGDENEPEQDTVRRCHAPRCKCCQHVQESNDFEINGKKHQVRRGGDCKSDNLIYGIRCRKCQTWYIGESSLKLRDRVNGHRASIKRIQKGETLNAQMTDTGAADHFSKKDHDFERDAEFHILEKGDWSETSDRKSRESFFICKFGTVEPNGMNKTTGNLAEFYGKF